MENWQDRILREALFHFGIENQKKVAVGEIGELLTLFGREAQGRATSEQWLDELADARIGIRQLEIIHGLDQMIDHRVDQKITRLAELMGKGQTGSSSLGPG